MSLKRKAADLANDAKKAKPNKSITSFFGAPVTKPKAEAAFDKAAWVEKLTDEQKDLLKLEIDTLHDSWLPHLKDVLLSAQFLELKRFLKKELASGKTVYPPMKDVYSWYVSICYITSKDDVITNSQTKGPDTRPSTPSRLSSWARIHTTAPIRPMVSASLFARPRPPLHLSGTFTSLSRKTTRTFRPRQNRAVC